MVPPHPDPSESIPNLEAIIPTPFTSVNVGVLLPSLFTVNAAIGALPFRQLPITVPFGEGGVP